MYVSRRVVVGEDPAARARSSFNSDHVRNLFCRMYFPLSGFLVMMTNSQWSTFRRSSKYSTLKWYLPYMSSVSHWQLSFDTLVKLYWEKVNYDTDHFIKNTLVINPCVTRICTLAQSSSPNNLHKLSLKPLMRS